jgi:hypothetical protein
MIASDLALSSDEDDDYDTEDKWERDNHDQLTEMYEAFLDIGKAWFGSGFYRTGGYYHFCVFVKSFYTQRHLF